MKGLAYRCARCEETHLGTSDGDPEVALRRAIETGGTELVTVHRCRDGSLGRSNLIGVASTFASAADQLAAMKGTAR